MQTSEQVPARDTSNISVISNNASIIVQERTSAPAVSSIKD